MDVHFSEIHGIYIPQLYGSVTVTMTTTVEYGLMQIWQALNRVYQYNGIHNNTPE